VSNGNGGWTRSVFAGNLIPDARKNPVAQNILTYYEKPNSPSTNQYQALDNFYGSTAAIVNGSNLTIRVDENWTNSWRSYWRFNYSGLYDGPTLMTGSTAEVSSSTHNPRFNGVWDNIIVLNPTTTIDLRANISRWTYDLLGTSACNGFNSNTLGFAPNLHAQAEADAESIALCFPGTYVSGLWGVGGNTGLYWHSNSGNPSASLTKVTSRHVIKAGGEYRKYYLPFYQNWGSNGSFNFDQTWTQQNPFSYNNQQGFGFASFLLGVPTSGDQYNSPAIAMSSSYWAGYVQDDFRVTKKLTLNYGLRYDVDIPRTERYNRMSDYDLNLPSPIAGDVPGFPNLVGAMTFMSSSHRQQTPTEYTQIAPRFGFAYRVNDKTVVRGGYGIFYDASPMQAANHNAGLEGYRNENPMTVSLNGLTPLNYLNNPYPNGFKIVGATGPTTDMGFYIADSYIPTWDTPRIQEWNFTLQRELPAKIALELAYIGNKGNHLQDGDGMNFNQLPTSDLTLGSQLNQSVPNPFQGVITNPQSILSAPTVLYSQLLTPYPQLTGLGNDWRPFGNSNYHALTVRAQRRFSDGLSFLAAFTGGKLISDSEASGFFVSNGGSAVQNTYDRRAERAVSTEDVPWRLVVTAEYQLPFGKGRKFLAASNRFVDAVVGGWQLNGLWTLQGGQPIPLTQVVNQTDIYTAMQRPTTNGQPATCTSGSKADRIADWFDASSFSVTAPFTLGNAGRTLASCREPGLANIDASLFKVFPILSEHRLDAQFRLEAFNAFNTAQFGRVNSTIGTTGIGAITYDAVSPRELQIALKLIF
jgi:hypothetical protein